MRVVDDDDLFLPAVRVVRVLDGPALGVVASTASQGSTGRAEDRRDAVHGRCAVCRSRQRAVVARPTGRVDLDDARHGGRRGGEVEPQRFGDPNGG